jgi:hypothetical protein
MTRLRRDEQSGKREHEAGLGVHSGVSFIIYGVI